MSTNTTNNTNSPLEIYNYLNKLKYDEKQFLQYHQFLVNQYFINFPYNRGLLIQHPPGSGKTILSASLAIHFAEQGRKIIILAPKSLQDNFKQEVEQYMAAGRKEDNVNVDDFTYVSLNANNILDQMGRIGESDVNRKFEKSLGDLGDIIRRDNKLNDSLLIIDEVHNLSNGITNGSKNAVGLYDLIMSAKNLKLLLLTGTPIINDAFELGILFNMVKGHIYDGKIRTTLFPEIRNEFDDYFVDYQKMAIKNVDMFVNRVYALSTYYGSFYEISGESVVKRKWYPDELKLIVEYVPMSGEQFSRYESARDREQEETAIRYKPIANVRFEKRSGSSTYRIATRQISNYVIPMYALGEVHEKKARKKFIDKITDQDLKNLDKFSPKFKKIIDNIHKCPGIAVVHSDFVSGEGINLLGRVLDQLGYQEWSPKSAGGIWFSEVGPGSSNGIYADMNIESDVESSNTIGEITFYGGKAKRYAILTGNVDPEDRTRVLKYVNNKLNKNGDLVKILLISSAGSEGISIFNARSIHLMSPPWNYARVNQIKARVIRFKSHEDLPPNQRNVKPYIYLSDYPDGYREDWKQKNVGKKWEDTTDITLFSRSIKQKRLNDYFLAASIRASIDCNIHTKKLSKADQERIRCLICQPTNKSLYHPNIAFQLKLPNPCDEYKKGDIIRAKEIIVLLDGQKQKFFYTFNKDTKKIVVLEFNENLDGYVPLNIEHPHYHDIYAILENKL